jgi:hypothetical protein
MANETKGANAPEKQIDSQSVEQTNPVEFVMVPPAYASRIKAFGNPIAFKDPKGLEKFGVTHYQTFTCPLPDGSTLRFTSFDSKFIKAVENDDVAEFYYKPAPAELGGSSEIDYRTSKQVANAMNQQNAKRSAKLLDAVFNVDNIENIDSLRERLLSNNIDKLLNATT